MLNKLIKNKWSALLAMAYAMSVQTAQAANGITSDTCAEGTLGGMACNMRQQLGEFGALIIGVFYVIGFGLTGLGIYFFWKNEQQPNQDHGKKGFIAILVGGGLLSLTYIVDASSTSMTGENQDISDRIDSDVGDEY